MIGRKEKTLTEKKRARSEARASHKPCEQRIYASTCLHTYQSARYCDVAEYRYALRRAICLGSCRCVKPLAGVFCGITAQWNRGRLIVLYMDNEDMALVKKLASYLREKLEKHGEAVLGSGWDAIPVSRGNVHVRFVSRMFCVCLSIINHSDSEVGLVGIFYYVRCY